MLVPFTMFDVRGKSFPCDSLLLLWFCFCCLTKAKFKENVLLFSWLQLLLQQHLLWRVVFQNCLNNLENCLILPPSDCSPEMWSANVLLLFSRSVNANFLAKIKPLVGSLSNWHVQIPANRWSDYTEWLTEPLNATTSVIMTDIRTVIDGMPVLRAETKT